MKTWILVATMALVAVGVSAQTPAPSPAPAPSTGNADIGKKLWLSVGCWQCHGYEGQGGAAGPRLSGRNLPLAGFTAYVRRPTNQMPPYTEKVLPSADLANMHAFLQSRPAPAQAASIPLLK